MNQLTIIGNIGRDPEMQITPAGKSVTKFSVAVSRRYTNADGQNMEHTDWLNVIGWGPLAETAQEFLVKGNKVLVIGRVELHQWDGQDGRRASMELTANSMEFLTPKASGGDYNADRVVESADVSGESAAEETEAPEETESGAAFDGGVRAGHVPSGATLVEDMDLSGQSELDSMPAAKAVTH